MKSLIERLYEPCILMKAVRTADSEGGYNTVWHESQQFSAAFNRSGYGMRARAERARDNVTAGKLAANVESVIAYDPAQIAIAYNDYVKRITDGAIFRVTSDPTETTSPKMMAVRFAQCSAERTVLPT